MAKTGKKKKTVNKSSVTGIFVSDEEVKKHPKTTYTQTIKKTKKRSSK